jgi:hypothetical protein
MAFQPEEVNQLLVETGRRCALCGKLHGVSIHHIKPVAEGGTDDIDNAIPLCPNCHDEIHGSHALGRTTRGYTVNELKKHRQKAIDRATKQQEWAHGSTAWEEDQELVLFYAQCLDRPAFRTRFHQELSFADFDHAMEDTLLALDTGHSRTRDGLVIERARGKVNVTKPEWREKLDGMARQIEEIRTELRRVLGLDADLSSQALRSEFITSQLRSNEVLGSRMDDMRQAVIDGMNDILRELGRPPLSGVGGPMWPNPIGEEGEARYYQGESGTVL